jgi:hypothetical protein
VVCCVGAVVSVCSAGIVVFSGKRRCAGAGRAAPGAIKPHTAQAHPPAARAGRAAPSPTPAKAKQHQPELTNPSDRHHTFGCGNKRPLRGRQARSARRNQTPHRTNPPARCAGRARSAQPNPRQVQVRPRRTSPPAHRHRRTGAFGQQTPAARAPGAQRLGAINRTTARAHPPAPVGPGAQRPVHQATFRTSPPAPRAGRAAPGTPLAKVQATPSGNSECHTGATHSVPSA